MLLALLLALGVRIGPAAGAGDAVAAFRLLKASYVVGEPIVVEFTLASGWGSVLPFSEGGDYRGTLRHDRYAFRVIDAAGRDFTRASDGHEGGEGREILLQPGRPFRSWQLLNGWIHLLPPGSYRVRCERKLGRDLVVDPWGDPVPRMSRVVAQDLSFEVRPYARAGIVSAIAELRALDRMCRDDVETFFGVPVEWAVADVCLKLGLGPIQVANGAAFERTVLDALPDRWDDRLFVEYGFRANRNWVTPGAPEPFELTLTARNNGRTPLPHRLDESALLVNGTAVPRWSTRVRELLTTGKKAATLAPGAVMELVVSCDDLVPPTGARAITWTLGGVKRSVELRVGR